MIKLKDLLNERYVSKRSDTIGDVFQSAVDSLEDLSDLFKKHAPEERTDRPREPNTTFFHLFTRKCQRASVKGWSDTRTCESDPPRLPIHDASRKTSGS